MQESDSREFLTPHFPTSLIHILPNGQLVYSHIPIATPPHPPAFGSISLDTDREHVSKQREKWGKVVLVMGLVMLGVAWVGLAGHVLVLKKTIHRGKWAVWGLGVGMCGMMVVLGLLAVRAGVKKTSSAVLIYIRILVLFTLLFVIALMLSSMLRLKSDTHKWKHHSSPTPSPSNLPNQSSISLFSKDKRTKDKDEFTKRTRKIAREAYMLGTFLLVLGTMGVFAGYVLCAVKLLTTIRKYERLFSPYEQGQMLSYMQMEQAVPVVSHSRRYPQVN